MSTEIIGTLPLSEAFKQNEVFKERKRLREARLEYVEIFEKLKESNFSIEETEPIKNLIKYFDDRIADI